MCHLSEDCYSIVEVYSIQLMLAIYVIYTAFMRKLSVNVTYVVINTLVTSRCE